MSDRITATYLIETPYPLEQAAEALAGEQSTGTFIQVPGETQDLRERFRAKVEGITAQETIAEPSLPGARLRSGAAPKSFQRGQVTLSFSLENIGFNLPTLLSTLAGNLFELTEFSGIRLLDFTAPAPFVQNQPGPRHGIKGTRELTGVVDRPLIGTIIKPSVGLNPDATANVVRVLAEGGIDFIKDDELMANPPHSPLEERIEAVMRVIREVADKTGKKVMYAFNISDEYEAMLRNQELVHEAGGTCVMVSLNSVGLSALASLRRHCALPIHGHRNGWGMLTRHPMLGIEFSAYQKFWRMAGVDQIHVNGLQNKFWESDESVVASIQACLGTLHNEDVIMPVISSGQWGGQAPDTYQRTNTVDVIYLAGGGIFAHPAGPAAGVRAIRQAWEAATDGIPLHDYAQHHSELRQSIEKFGKKQAEQQH